MFDIPDYKSPVSLIPGGPVQFLDFLYDTNLFGRHKRSFKEEKRKDEGEKAMLIPYTMQDEVPISGLTGKPIDVAPGLDAYDVDARKCLDNWKNEWIPLPFLRLRDQQWPDGGERFECGPSNWARCYVTEMPDNPQMLRFVLAFDMGVEEQPAEGEEYYALSPKDVAAHAAFRLATHARDNAWFLNSLWVDEWLKTLWQARQKKRNDDDGFSLEYLASYLTFLDVISFATKDVAVQVINPKRDNPIDVDLILDIGNSRSTGILVETLPQKITNLNDSYPLQLRDMDRPYNVYTEPFDTRIEFSEVSFGNDSLSRRSGRRSPAFSWPSMVRIGPEAARLSTFAVCAEGSTGMSSPKRYLWDERAWQQSWRYNTRGGPEPMVTRGLMPKKLNKYGTPIVCFDDPLFKKNPQLRSQEQEVAFESMFTRSSLMMFLMVEIIIQALTTINSPAQRVRRELPNLPRRLRRIIFTIPPGMPKAEQKIYNRWVQWAVRVLWDAFGWQDYFVDQRRISQVQPDYRLSPMVRSDWDEATCTQLVYLYNELTRKFQGDAHHLFQTMGKRQERFHNRPCLRIATIDVGGGTTDLSITTFELESDESSSARITPHTDFRDGFNIAGDEILRAVIDEHVLAAIAEAARSLGLQDPSPLLAQLFGRDIMDSTQSSRTKRGQFIRQVAVPVALGILRLYEEADLRAGGGGLTRTFGDFFTPESQPAEAILDYVERMVKRHTGKQDFTLMDVPVRVEPQSVDMTIRKTLADVFANLCEVIHVYDCDLLLLSGRPTRFKAIISSVFAKLPVPADRIIPMCDYRVGSWYPFADALGNITDPKTTVVVGAILCALAEGHLEGFSFDTPSLKLKSTAKYIGEMDINGQIKTPKVWFNVDIDNKSDQEFQKQVIFSNPIAVGFRQLMVERWTTTRFYLIDFSSEEARRRASGKLPFTLSMRLFIREQEKDDERDEGELFIEDIVDREGNAVNARDLEARLQTLPLDEGFWMDTGIVKQA